MSELNINPEVSEKRFKETSISLNHNNRKRSGFKVDQLECNHSSLYIKSKIIFYQKLDLWKIGLCVYRTGNDIWSSFSIHLFKVFQNQVVILLNSN